MLLLPLSQPSAGYYAATTIWSSVTLKLLWWQFQCDWTQQFGENWPFWVLGDLLCIDDYSNWQVESSRHSHPELDQLGVQKAADVVHVWAWRSKPSADNNRVWFWSGGGRSNCHITPRLTSLLFVKSVSFLKHLVIYSRTLWWTDSNWAAETYSDRVSKLLKMHLNTFSSRHPVLSAHDLKQVID